MAPLPRKSAKKSAPGRPFKRGGDPRQGRGPAKGAPNAGRPPNEHIDWCRRVVSDPSAESAVETVLKDPKHPAFASMWKAVAERGYGKAAQPLELTGKDGGPIQHEHRQEWEVAGRRIAWN